MGTLASVTARREPCPQRILERTKNGFYYYFILHGRKGNPEFTSQGFPTPGTPVRRQAALPPEHPSLIFIFFFFCNFNFQK